MADIDRDSRSSAGALIDQAVATVDLPKLLLALAALIVLRLALLGGPELNNDSYQYLNVAGNMTAERDIVTSLVHFDTERNTGQMPAPAVSFPGGYPLLIWAGAWAVGAAWAAQLISAAAVLATAWLIWRYATREGFSSLVRAGLTIAWVTAAQVIEFGTRVQSEAVFTALIFAAVVLLSDRTGGSKRRATGGALIGASVWVRYAGLFVLLAFNLFVAISIARRRRSFREWAPALTGANLPPLVLLLWNQARAGSWNGGHDIDQFDGFGALAEHLMTGTYSLLFGSVIRPWSFPMVVFVSVFAAALLVSASALVSGLGKAKPSTAGTDAGFVLILTLAVYLGGIVVADLTTSAAITARLLFPVLPIVLVLIGTLVDKVLASPDSSRSITALAVALPLTLAGLIGANVVSLFERPDAAPHEIVEVRLATPDATGEPMSRVIGEVVPNDGVVLAMEGQATGHVIDRGVISTVGNEFSKVVWDESEVRQTMNRYGASYLLVYPEDADLDGSMPFFQRLALGDVPTWLHEVSATPTAILFEAAP